MQLDQSRKGVHTFSPSFNRLAQSFHVLVPGQNSQAVAASAKILRGRELKEAIQVTEFGGDLMGGPREALGLAGAREL